VGARSQIVWCRSPMFNHPRYNFFNLVSSRDAIGSPAFFLLSVFITYGLFDNRRKYQNRNVDFLEFFRDLKYFKKKGVSNEELRKY